MSPKGRSNRGKELKKKMGVSEEEPKVNESNSNEESDYTDVITELFVSLSTSDNKLLSKLFVLVNKYNSDERFPKTYHVSFIVSSKDSNEYKLDTELMINAKCYVQFKKLLGDERLWME